MTTERYEKHYTQPMPILDTCWDALMEEGPIAGGLFIGVTDMMLKGVKPTDISHLIDVVITAYRKEYEK